MEWKSEDFSVTDNLADVDLDYLFSQLSQTYWAAERSFSQMKAAVENSLVFVLLHQGRQIGFARVISDRAVIGYLADVIIDPDYRGQGLGKWLVSCVLSHPELQSCKLLLETLDAHGLYQQFDFYHWEAMKRDAAAPFGV
jgi:GNAT superfamily N-acetyltransferase